ncbi:MAG: YsnF/AvaK domain-containing protein [Acidobacteriota bacterium]|nr:YsnF/AvaK domain-containing protein [Acidobacteriota bacterium]
MISLSPFQGVESMMPNMPSTDNTGLTDNSDLKIAEGESEIVVPLHFEEASVSKRSVETGRVRVSTTTHHNEQLIEEILAQEEVSVERKAVGKSIDAMPAVREEGDMIIVPVVEEVLVVERRLMLKEEIYIKRVRGTKRFQERVVLRKQEAVVERIPAESSNSGAGSVPDVTSQSEINKEI